MKRPGGASAIAKGGRGEVFVDGLLDIRVSCIAYLFCGSDGHYPESRIPVNFVNEQELMSLF